MAINASGLVSLGGSNAGTDVAAELGLSATGMITMNDTPVRELAGKTADASMVSFDDFHGKSKGTTTSTTTAAPTTLPPTTTQPPPTTTFAQITATVDVGCSGNGTPGTGTIRIYNIAGGGGTPYKVGYSTQSGQPATYATTDAGGTDYTFTNVPNGSYIVYIYQPTTGYGKLITGVTVSCTATTSTTTSTTTLVYVWYNLYRCDNGTTTTSAKFVEGTFGTNQRVMYGSIYFYVTGAVYSDPGGTQWSVTSAGAGLTGCPATTAPPTTAAPTTTTAAPTTTLASNNSITVQGRASGTNSSFFSVYYRFNGAGSWNLLRTQTMGTSYTTFGSISVPASTQVNIAFRVGSTDKNFGLDPGYSGYTGEAAPYSYTPTQSETLQFGVTV